jgi:hypothetical protein
MAGEMKERPRNMGSRRLFAYFLVAQKVGQPVEAVDHNIGHSFIGIMNKVTRHRNPWSIKTGIHYVLSFSCS